MVCIIYVIRYYYFLCLRFAFFTGRSSSLFLVLDRKDYHVPSSVRALFLLGVSWYSFGCGCCCCDDCVGGGVGSDGGG